MPKKQSQNTKIIAIALMVLGLGLAYWGYQLSGSVESKITQVISGANTDKVMMFYIGGAVSFIVGIYLYIKK